MLGIDNPFCSIPAVCGARSAEYDKSNTPVHGANDAFDLEDRMAFVRYYFESVLDAFEIDHHSWAVGTLLKH